MNNERSAQKSFDVTAGQSVIVNIEAAPKTSGFVDVAAEIETDEIEQDNKRFTSIFIPEKISVGLFAESQNDLTFVNLALQTTGESKYEIERKNISQLTSQQLSKYQVIIISANSILNGIEQIKDFVGSGGGLILFPASTPYISSFNRTLSQLNLGNSQSIVGNVGGGELRIKFDKTDFNHPVFQNIFKSDDKKKYESPELNAYYKLTQSGNQIISLIDGSSFLNEIKINKGKVFVFNCAPVLSWSDFPIKSIFAPLINKSVVYLAAKEREQFVFSAGEQISINLKGTNQSQIKIVRPDESEEFISLNENSTKDYLAYSNTSTAGNYKFYSGDKLIDDISVNTDPTESKTEYADKDDFENYLSQIKFDGVYTLVAKEENISEKIMQARFGSELWRYFLLTAIILALVEMTIARNTKKELEGI